MTIRVYDNPFTVKTPEGLLATEAVGLFVDVFTEFYKVRDPGHAFLNGPRGSGKSMMFRFLEPDCQRIDLGCSIQQLEFFAILISIKNTTLNLTELRQLHGTAANVILNEHFLAMYVASKVFTYVADLNVDPTNTHLPAVSSFVTDVVHERLVRCGLEEDVAVSLDHGTTTDTFRGLADLCDRLYHQMGQYVKRLFPGVKAARYSGPLCGYLDFLYPVFRGLSELCFMPNGPIYLLMDDADTLSRVQTRILNSWVGTRTSQDVSIKISTQHRYKTFTTIGGNTIEAPHDYSEVNISDLYTTKRGVYLDRVKEIVARRLSLQEIDVTPEELFPVFQTQEDRVRRIEEQIRGGDHPVSGKGYRISDDVQRYARPIYIRSLAGTKKASSKYSYAGFEQLVHISSGVIRYFLESAALMFSEQRARGTERVVRIEPKIQNEQIRKMSSLLMTAEFDKIGEGEQDAIDGVMPLVDQKRKLHNLIQTLGGTFRQKLLSDDAERRIFSVAISGEPAADVIDIFELGVRHGYFQKSTIGNKDGTGRTTLYILTRRLAPYFVLDPSGFAGYLFVQCSRLREGMVRPQAMLRRIRRKGVEDAFGEEVQLDIFD